MTDNRKPIPPPPPSPSKPSLRIYQEPTTGYYSGLLIAFWGMVGMALMVLLYLVNR